MRMIHCPFKLNFWNSNESPQATRLLPSSVNKKERKLKKTVDDTSQKYVPNQAMIRQLESYQRKLYSNQARYLRTHRTSPTDKKPAMFNTETAPPTPLFPIAE